MPASTVIAATANDQTFYRGAKVINNGMFAAPLRPLGIYPFDTGAVTVATTSLDDIGDEVFVVKFPDNCYLGDFQITVTDMDSNATPTLVFSVITENSAGTEVVYTATTTIGQGGGTDEPDLGVQVLGKEVSNLYLGIKVTTAAATAAQGTVRIKGLVWLGQSGIGLS